jgi:hypothetical protein
MGQPSRPNPAFFGRHALDDPDNHPETQREASELLASMMDEFQASSGIAGVELCQRRSKTDPFPPVEN